MPPAPTPGRQTNFKGDTPSLPQSARDIGDSAVWSVTSAKPGNGVELLRDGSNDTFWQCVSRSMLSRHHSPPVKVGRGAAAPGEHRLWPQNGAARARPLLARGSSAAQQLFFAQELAVYVDLKLDESYTPKLLSVRVGNSLQDLKARRESWRLASSPHPALAGGPPGAAC